LVISIALLPARVVGFYAWMQPSRNDWFQPPSRLVCAAHSGPTPPPSVIVAAVGAEHPGALIYSLVDTAQR
jgi:hypothetical protein